MWMGHKYLEQAAASGAGAALVEDVPEVCPDGLTLLKVADTPIGNGSYRSLFL